MGCTRKVSTLNGSFTIIRSLNSLVSMPFLANDPQSSTTPKTLHPIPSLHLNALVIPERCFFRKPQSLGAQLVWAADGEKSIDNFAITESQRNVMTELRYSPETLLIVDKIRYLQQGCHCLHSA